MKSFFKFILTFASILLVSAVLAPFLFTFLPFKFERIFNRLVMVFSLAAIVLYVRKHPKEWKEYDFTWSSNALGFFGKAFIVSVLVLILLTAIRVMTGFCSISFPDISALSLIGKLIFFVFTGLLIAVIEEFFFRGFIDYNFRIRFRMPVIIAVIATSLFYSSLHFIRQKKIWIDQTPTFLDSLKLMTAPFLSLMEPGIWPAFIGLFLFGVVLHHLRLRTQSLYPGIGLHAGCVFFVKSDGMFVDLLKSLSLWMGSKVFYDGVMGWVFILLLGGILHFWLPKATRKQSSLNV